MDSTQEFSYIASQLEWLEGHLRALPAAEQSGRMDSALNALTCARAVIDELAHIGSTTHAPEAAPTAARAS